MPKFVEFRQSRWHQYVLDIPKLLVLPLATAWPIEILRIHLSEFITISLVLGLFRQKEIADATVYQHTLAGTEGS